MTTLREFPVEEFLWGLGAAVLALLAVTVESRRRADHALVAGLVTTAAALGAISRTWSVVPAALVGLGGLAAALAWLDRCRLATGRELTTAAVVMTPFAAVLAVDASSTGWVRGVIGASVVLGALAASRTDAAWGETGVPPVLYAITAAGVFAAVPDTEQAATLLGATVPLAVCGWPLGHARLGPTGAGAATALAVWVAAVGGRGREPSVIGAVACLGLLVTLPAGRWLAGKAGHPRALGRGRPAAVPLVCLHLVVVAVASRVAGVTSDLEVAIPVAVVTMLVALAASAWLDATQPLGHNRPPPMPRG